MTAKAVEKLNEQHPLSMLIDIADDNKGVVEKVEALLDRNGLTNRRKFFSPEEYRKALEENPLLTPNIAIVDYRYEGHVLDGYQLTLMLVSRTKRKILRPKVIMITGFDHPRTIRNFFHKGGFAWLNKHDIDFDDQLVERVMEAISEFIEIMEDRAFFGEMEEEVVEEERILDETLKKKEEL
jgi:FixJ family two-component response regulator